MNLTSTAQLSAQLYDGEKIYQSITIKKKPEEVFLFFRDLTNLPYFMKDLKSIQVKSPTISHWVIYIAKKLTLEWDAQIVREQYGEMISWQSLENSEIKQLGTILFLKAPKDLGTVVRVSMAISIPGGKITEMATRYFGEDPDTLVKINLQRLKSYLETGEIPTAGGLH